MNADDLKRWRDERGMTQTQLAAALSVAPITVSQWEVGRRAVPAWLPVALDGVTCRTQRTEAQNCGAEP